MIHSQFEKLADLLINHSCSLEKGEKVLIEAFDIPQEMVIATIRAARKVGGIPFVTWKNNLILKELISDTTEEHMGLMGDVEKFRMKEMDAYIGMGHTAENLAKKYSISRDEQEKMALESHQKASVAQENNEFKDEIITVNAIFAPLLSLTQTVQRYLTTPG